ncbi:MAG TPA: hypothetical protein VLJ39_06045 [Tepidisphaeraceae bacterium]|nr:hypothetical protein [Tepidisphaeraceae bacterium]
MTLITVEGNYKNGRIDLTEAPVGIDEAQVIVTFLPKAQPAKPSRPIYFGMFKGDRETNEEDFKIAEWHGPKEDSGGQ